MLDNGGTAAPLAPTLAYTIEDQSGRGPQVVWSDEPVTVTVKEALLPRLAMQARDDEHEVGDARSGSERRSPADAFWPRSFATPARSRASPGVPFIASGRASAPAHAGKASGPDRRVIGASAIRPSMDLQHALISRRQPSI